MRDIVVILVTCKNEEDPLKNKDARVATTQNMDFSNMQGQITLQSEVRSGRNSNSSEMLWITPYIRLVKFQLVRQIPDVYVSACVLAGKLFLLFFLVLLYFS